MKIYVIGSLRNPAIPGIGCRLRKAGFEVFDDFMASGPEADDFWKLYELERGRSFPDALKGEHARAVFELDRKHLDECDGALLVMPAGKSAFMELGYVLGQGKLGVILLEDNSEADRWDVMFRFATAVTYRLSDAIVVFNPVKGPQNAPTGP